MQILKIYTIYDSKAEAYLNPFYARSNGEAMRMFEQAMNDPQSHMSKSPQDFSLWELGAFNDSDATHELKSPKLHLYDGIDALKQDSGIELADNVKQLRK